MPYVGAKLEPWFDRRPTLQALYGMADRGGRRMVELTRMNTPVDTAALRASWTQKPVTLTPTGNFESGVETDVEYAPHVEYGTGLWGPSHSKYPIRPKHPDGWLHWIDPITGGHVFRKEVMHPGSPGNHMIAIGAAITEHEFPEFAQPLLLRWARRTELQNRTGIGR